MSSEAETFACEACGENVPKPNKLMHTIQCGRHSNHEATSINLQDESPAHGEVSTALRAEEAEFAQTCPADENADSSEEVTATSSQSTDLHGDSIVQSQSSDASIMLVTCEFCEIDVPLRDLSEHAYICGNRTDICEGCMCYVRLCDFPSHRTSGCTEGATASAMRTESQTEHTPLLQPANEASYHRERQVRLAEPEVPRWAPVVIAAVGVGAAVAFSAITRRR